MAKSAGLSDVVPLAMSRQDIADHLGLTIETVSRTFTRFDRDGILAVSRHSVKIIDLRRLEAMAMIDA
jgi:CRP/FNR family transcriptional regulator